MKLTTSTTQRIAALVAVILGMLGSSTTQGQTKEMKSGPMQSVVIVHGAWGGAHHWKQVGDGLMRDGRLVVRRASLTGQGERVHLSSPQVNLDTHIDDVVNLIKFDDLHDVILIGHSYGGCVISGVADRVPERISRLIHLDSHLLDDGECFCTGHPKELKKYTKAAKTKGDGWKIPGNQAVGDVAHPLATLTQPIKLTNPDREKIDSTYWLFLDGKELKRDSRLQHYQRAQERGWPVKTFAWGHNPQRDNVAEITRELHAAITRESDK